VAFFWLVAKVSQETHPKQLKNHMFFERPWNDGEIETPAARFFHTPCGRKADYFALKKHIPSD